MSCALFRAVAGGSIAGLTFALFTSVGCGGGGSNASSSSSTSGTSAAAPGAPGSPSAPSAATSAPAGDSAGAAGPGGMMAGGPPGGAMPGGPGGMMAGGPPGGAMPGGATMAPGGPGGMMAGGPPGGMMAAGSPGGAPPGSMNPAAAMGMTPAGGAGSPGASAPGTDAGGTAGAPTGTAPVGGAPPGATPPAGIAGGPPGGMAPGGATPGGAPGGLGLTPPGGIGLTPPGGIGLTPPGGIGLTPPGGIGLTPPGGLPGGMTPGGIGSPGAPGSQGTAAQTPKTFQELANEAFTQGRDDNAFQYLYAHYLTKDDAEVPFAWYKALKRPALGVRWAVGVDFTGSDEVQNDPFPVGKNQAKPQRGAGRRGGPGAPGGAGAPGGIGGPGAPGPGAMGMPGMAGMAGMMGGAGANSQNGELQRLAGELATTTIEELQDRVASGNYGEVLQSAPAIGATNNAGGMPGMAGMGMMMPGTPGMPGGAPGLGGPAPGGPPGAAAGRSDARSSGRNSATPLMAGVNYIGIDKTANLREKAQRLGMDVLFVFQIKATKNPKKSMVTNETRIYVYTVEGNVEIAKGDEINNIAVQNAREKDSGDETVDKMFDKVFKNQIDEKLKAEELPSLVTGDVIRQRRLPDLTASPLENPLPALAEIRFYRSRDLITDEDVLAAYTKLLEDEEDAKTLASGSEEDRKKVLEEWLPNKGEKKS